MHRLDRVQNMRWTHVQSVLIRYTPPARHAFLRAKRAIRTMVASRARASKEEAPTTVSTFSTTLPIVLEAADAPASMCEHMMVGESAGTAGKGQSRQPAARPCPVGWQVRTPRLSPGASAPCRSSAMPTPTRPAILSLHAACHGAHESRVGRERCARSAAYRHTCDDDEAREFIVTDAPPTLASSVHFFGAAPLIDSTARWAAVLRLDTGDDILVLSRGGGPASPLGVHL